MKHKTEQKPKTTETQKNQAIKQKTSDSKNSTLEKEAPKVKEEQAP